MSCCEPASQQEDGRPRLEVADIFRAHGDAYARNHVLTPDQDRVMQDIVRCRTAELGGHLDKCELCSHERPSYNSCRNRHCPKCQSLAQAKWIEKRKERILPIHYFHVVFTLPGQLRPLTLGNRKTIFALLFEAGSRTLLDLARDPKRLGAQLGITAVLHTWTRDLRFHPHLHCIVTGGGLNHSAERWVPTKLERYLFPREVIAKLFRNKFLDALKRAYKNEKLRFRSAYEELADPTFFRVFVDKLYNINWGVYAKRPFGGPQQVFEYLGRYTHRVAISNHRLISSDDDGVTFITKRDKTITLPHQEFIRRFLLHVLPSGFVKIRHFGIKASGNVNTKLVRARELLEEQNPSVGKDSNTEATNESDAHEPESWQEQMRRLTGTDLSICPLCGEGKMIRRPLPKNKAMTNAREPPGEAG